MQVEKLFIFYRPTNSGDKESELGAQALFDRNTLLRKIPTELVLLPDGGSSKSCTLVAGETNPHAATDNVGVYVLGHGSGLAVQRLGGHDAAGLAGHVAGYLLTRNVTSVRKVCLVSCGMAREESGSGSFLELFAQALADNHALYPMVAGWDNFVSVVFPGMQATAERGLRTTDPGATKLEEMIEAEKYDQHLGRKYAAHSFGRQEYVLPTNGIRAKHKKFVWIKKDGPVTLDLAGWHDAKD